MQDYSVLNHQQYGIHSNQNEISLRTLSNTQWVNYLFLALAMDHFDLSMDLSTSAHTGKQWWFDQPPQVYWMIRTILKRKNIPIISVYQ